MNPYDQIILTGLRATGYHGVLEHERRDGQVFVIDVTVHVPMRAPGASDDIDDTIHYGELAEQIVAAVERDPVDLIETVAERIAETVLAHELAVFVDVTVHKPHAPIPVPFDDVAVKIMRGRPDRMQRAGFAP
jgi:dihydroneopterin aldolase